jgi:hypothetical protein
MDAGVDPPTTPRNRNFPWRVWRRVALPVTGGVLEMVGVVVIITASDPTNPATFRQRNIAGCLFELGLLCFLLVLLSWLPAQRTPQWLLPVGYVLASALLVILLSALALVTFAPPSSLDLAETLLIGAGTGQVVVMAAALVVRGDE